MKKRTQSLALALLFGWFFTQVATAAQKPNIIWIFSDDHSYQTIGAYGGRLQKLGMTPNIDRLASEGMRFDRCYVSNSICGPSRAVLLTGKHSHLNGKRTNGKGANFNHNQMNFAKILQKNGYQTAMIGKIHLSGKMQGFDYWDVVQNIDFAETFLAMAGVKAPEEMQGESIVPLMKGKTPNNWRKSLYYHYYEFPQPHAVSKHEGVSEKRYKLIRFYGKGAKGGEEWEFYDLKNDPSEMKSEYENTKYAEEVKRMKKELLRLRRYYKLPVEA